MPPRSAPAGSRPHGASAVGRGGRTAAWHLVLALLCAIVARAAPLTSPTYLDPGDIAEERPDTVRLRPGDRFDAARGYGWSRAPAATFHEAGWGGVRSPPLRDGSSGPDLGLELELAPGHWTALAYLDDGYRDAHQVEILVNGQPYPHSGREFGLEEEPAPPPINRYRVAQFAFAARGRTEIRFIRRAPHGARLLALHVLPAAVGDSDRARWIRRQVVEVGRHGSRAPLDALRFELRELGREPTLRAFAEYWRAQFDLLAEAERWHAAGGWDWVSVHTSSSMFTRYKIALSLLDALVDHPDGAEFPLRERALWLRCRLLYWIWVEQHLPKDKEAFDRDIAEVRRRHPGDPLVAMYAGERIETPLPGLRTAAPGAPPWSVAQTEALQRLRAVAHYWIDERQIPNGELGGKPDDDVETLRWWPALMFSGDHKVTAAFGRLADGVWFSPRIHLGYSREPRDVEHSAEFVADTVPLMAFLTRDEEWIGRLAWSQQHMRDLWTGRNAHGDLQFKSAWIGATHILTDEPRNRDVSMNARAAKAVRFLGWLRNDAEADRLLHGWSRTWARAALRTEKAKPPGVFPASLRWPDAAMNGDEPSWHRANMFWHYFDWRADGMLYDQLLCSALRTGDASLHEPMRAALRLVADWRDPVQRAGAPEGSAGWAAERLLQSPDFWGVVTQWRLETGDGSYDTLLRDAGPPYLRFRLAGDEQSLAVGIEQTLLTHLRYNTPLRTTEVLFTDRIHVARDIGNCDGIDLLIAMLTGNHAPSGMSPYYHVAWDVAPAGFTALVHAARSDEFVADVYVHEDGDGAVVARLFRLAAGRYRFSLSTGGHRLLEREELIADPNHSLAFQVPVRALVRVQLRATSP